MCLQVNSRWCYLAGGGKSRVDTEDTADLCAVAGMLEMPIKGRVLFAAALIGPGGQRASGSPGS